MFFGLCYPHTINTIKNKLNCGYEISFISCEKIDASTWVEELTKKKEINPKDFEEGVISQYEKTINRSKINQAIVKAKWESHKTGKKVIPTVHMSYFTGLT